MPPFNLDSEETSQQPPPGNSSGNGETKSHAEEIANESPEVQQHAVDAALAKETANSPPTESASGAAPKVDKAGVAFDAAKHTGTLLKSGNWRERKSTISAPKKSAKTSAAEVVATATNENKARAAAAVSVQMLTGTMTQFFGAEWQCRTKAEAGFDERDFMVESWGDYFVHKGIDDIPPGAAFGLSLINYFGTRAMMPETKKKVGRIKTWIALRLAKRALKKEFKKRNIMALVEIKDGVLLVDGKPRGEK